MASALEPNRLGPAIDEQGATNEQSTAYASFAHYLWARGAEQLAACGLDVPPKMTERTPRMPRFIGHSIQPNGRFVQLGDTYAEPPSTVPPGTEVEYAASLGSTGTPPASPVAIYAAGYVFGRSGWGTERPFAGESFYSLRFGPGRQVHGHNDHMSLTWYARGRELLVDSGHVGYETSTYRAFLRSPEAHNVLTMPGVRFSASAPTTLTRSAVRATGAFYEMSDTAYAGRPRKRSVYVAHGPDIVVVFDRASGATRYEQLWHLDPQFDATVRSSAAATAVARGGNTRLWMFQVPFPSQTIPAGSTRVVKGRTSPYQGWVSRRMLHREAAPVVTMTRTGASTSMLTLLVPARLTAQVGYSFTRRQDGWYRLDVRIATSVSRFLVSPGGYIKPG